MKKRLSLILAIMIILSSLPMGELVAFAAEGDPTFTSVTVNKVFKDLYGVEKYSILILGNNFMVDGKNIVEVGLMGGDGTVKAFTPTYSSKTMLQYELEPGQITGNIFIEGKEIDISENNMPYITNKTPTTGVVDNAGDAKITLIGSRFNNITDPNNKIEAFLFQENSTASLTVGSDTELSSTELKGKTGIWSVQFRKKTKSIELSNADIIISHRYMDMFSVLNKLDVSENIDLIPTQGSVESIAMLQAEHLKPTNEMSVFFLKGLDEPYLASHMAINENYRRDDKLKKDIFSFTVPKALTPGSYYVVLTNEVNPTKDIKSQIKSYKVLETKFIVIDRKNMVVIDSINPNKGSSKGVDAVIKGINIARISPDIYENGARESIDIGSNTNKMIVKYKDGTYKMIGENGVQVKNLTREIKFIIGGEVTFRDESDLGQEVYDYINVRVGENFDNEKLVYDVIAEITTKIQYEENGETKTTEIFETYTLKNGFTYEALDYVPKIISIVPDKIPVDSNLHAMEGLKVAIIGENFLLYRYKDENGKIHYKYPKFDFGGQFKIDPNKDENIEIRILNKQGNEIDGTDDNHLGTKILLTIPANKEVKEDILNNQIDLKVTNPIRVPDSQDEGSSATYKFQFIKPEGDKTPFITSVTPDTITTSGEKGIIISGQNFAEKFNLYMDGEKITSAKRNGTGTEITFDAPPKPEGYVQLIVQNDDGALATYDKLLYVKTYTDPKITDFNPKKGTAKTLVDLKGQNLVPPNPLVKDLSGVGFMKLIGTRIFIGGKDINTYTTDHKLKEYTTPSDEPIISAKNNSIIPSDYYHSIILEENEVYYKIYFDTISGKYYLTDGDKDIYQITAKGDKLYGKKGGDPEKEITVTDKKVEIDGKTLVIKTPYSVEGGKIVGNRVKVINSNELYFEVPPQPREGYYDIAIVNPDTKKDERKGNAGFYYFFQPNEKPPKIKEITPSEGSTEGQYNIIISGENFVDRGPNEKTSVIIGGITVPSQDVVVSPNGNTMTVKVPKYPGDLSKETDMDRKYVNVIVINPDGGSDRRINGFAYIIPISHPKITKLILNKGSAAGGDIVTIEGSDFRYFEPFRDANNNGIWDEGETYTDKNGNGKWDDLRDKKVLDELKPDWDEKVLPILPTVYFGGKVAKIKSFTASTIDIEVPKGAKGSAEVYLVNNDYGVSNKLIFTYESSNPKINSITPNTGRKQGGDKLEILGEGFIKGDILVYDDLKSLPKLKEIAQIQFAKPNDENMTNINLPLDNPNSGRVRDKIAQAKAGQLELKYDATGKDVKLSMTVTDNNIKYTAENILYNNEEVFFPLNLLKNDKGENYKGNELVRIRLEKIQGASNTFRVRLDKGFSPEAAVLNQGHINVITPSYYTIGEVEVNLTNPDNGVATGKFNYKNPDSKPKITNILRDGQEGYKVEDGRTIVEVNYLGGNTIEIIGQDFRKPVKIQIGDITINAKIEYQPEEDSISNRLIFKMPAIENRYIGTYNRVVVENEDGGVANSEPIFIKFTTPESTGLTITKVTPNFGPTSGGTVITIEGKDFREKMDGIPNGKLKVYFGEGSKQVQVPQENIISIAYDKIILKTPPYTAGPATIKVENPDGNIAELPNGFNYVSNPKITSVVNPNNNKVLVETLSIEGGEKIKIIGSDFMEGAKVVFNPVLKLVDDKTPATGEVITIGTKKYILESGTEGTEVEVVNGQTITVITPEGKLDDKGIIVINPDKGATDVYNIGYGIPDMDAPFNVEAEVVYDQFIKVHWSGVKDAFEYEIYMSEDGDKFEFIGTTELTSYVVQNIKSRTEYQFLVRAIGKYGTSKPIDESKSNYVTTGRGVGPEDEDGSLGENTVINRNGTMADISIGTEDFNSKGMTIDLTRGELAGVKDITIRIPAEIVVNSFGNIKVLGKDYTMEFSPNIFKNSTMEDNRKNSNAGVVFKVSAYKGNTNVKSGEAVVGETYLLEGTTYVDKDISKIDYLRGNIKFTLDTDTQKVQNRRLNRVQMVRYDENTKTWVPVNYPNRLGLYTVIGSRR
ncbi:IPT/TIG domain-containing protein [Tissierella praeacuta]|uniref:IPT/TIG domain-containing protein n=1 Tax=Tissierella praeacuta TaxID=43131 RepID=UPI0010466B6D|nr:IPT/TIG domain-containing protein [Tissierella praeacuta]TCU79174.1 IPT/TIG domain-containing protein [Tissierella praeacuta]